jgi:hypothetical protein
MLVLEADWFAAVITKIGPDRVEGAAVVTQHLGRIEGINLDLRGAVLTIGAEMLEALEIAALALPVAYLILDVLEGRGLTKIGNREDG